VPRERSPNRNKAYEMWVQSGKKLELKRIAEELGLSAEQVRKWKNEDKWDSKTNSNVTNQNTKMNSNVTKRKGAPKGNKNNFKHGIYENALIVVTENENGEIAVSGRAVHEFLEVKTKYNDWFNRKLDYDFLENTDFILVTQKKSKQYTQFRLKVYVLYWKDKTVQSII